MFAMILLKEIPLKSDFVKEMSTSLCVIKDAPNLVPQFPLSAKINVVH